MGIPDGSSEAGKERLYVTIYPDDQEAHDYWHKMIGISEITFIR